MDGCVGGWMNGWWIVDGYTDREREGERERWMGLWGELG